nr:predicted exonuclease of the beta-lactamase fold involved in RNA processing [uncultured Gammaproteobacteria bacterium]
MYEKNQNFSFDPATVDAMLVSHAHMDHSGNIPNLVKKGFKGPVYATPPTVDLCQLMLRDSAHLQKKDIDWVNRIRAKHHQPPMEPLYSMDDAEESLHYFQPVEYDKSFEVIPGVQVTFKEAGHILGSACILFEINEKGRRIEMGFTGDLGRAGMPILRDPVILRELDALIIESTYGNRSHDPISDAGEEMAKTIREVAAAGGKIIIPAFAIGRTQELIYMLHKLYDQNRIPEIPVFIDSPLAVHATDVFRKYAAYYDREAFRIFLAQHNDPFAFQMLKYVESTEESKRLNGLAFPHIIISASGMAEGGRILHHLANNIENPKTLILFVGFAAKETLARKIMDGNETVKIFGEEHRVKARVKILQNFSAHGDRRDIIEYVKMSSPAKLKNLFLVHGEPDQAIPLRDAFQSMGYQNVQYPVLNEKVMI